MNIREYCELQATSPLAPYVPSNLEDALYCADAQVRIALRFTYFYGQPCCDVLTTVTTSTGTDESFTVVAEDKIHEEVLRRRAAGKRP